MGRTGRLTHTSEPSQLSGISLGPLHPSQAFELVSATAAPTTATATAAEAAATSNGSSSSFSGFGVGGTATLPPALLPAHLPHAAAWCCLLPSPLRVQTVPVVPVLVVQIRVLVLAVVLVLLVVQVGAGAAWCRL